MPQPALRLDFAGGAYHPGGFGPTITFRRSSQARYHDASGAMQVAAVDEPRIDHNRGTGVRRGLLIERGSTNLFLNSSTPVTQNIATTAQMYALSFWGAGAITLTGAHSAILTGAASPARSVLVFTATAGTLTLTVAGDVQMAQLEAGNCATSYVPTTGAVAARAGDQATLPLGSWWNPDEGTMLVEWQDINQQPGSTRIIGMAGSRTLMNLSGATGTAGNTAPELQMWNGAASLIVAPAGAPDLTKGIQRAIAAWSPAGRSIATRGTLATSATPLFNTGAPSELYLGAQLSPALPINGCLRKISYWPKRLADAKLVAMVT